MKLDRSYAGDHLRRLFALLEPSATPAEAGKACREIWPRASEAVLELLEAMRRESEGAGDDDVLKVLIAVLAALAPLAVPRMLKAFRSRHIGFRINLAIALGELRASRAAPLLAKTLGVYVSPPPPDATPDEKEESRQRLVLRLACAIALGKIGKPGRGSVKALMQVAGSAKEEQSLRSYAIEALQEMGPMAKAAVPALLAIKDGDADEDLRQFAGSALLAIARGASVERVKAMYTTRREDAAGHSREGSVAAISRAIAAANREQASEALAAIDESVRLDPGNPTAWFWRGRFLAEQGRPAEAIRDMEQALSLEPDDDWGAELEDLRRRIRN
jgi:tetratricopeptide (TPR) repeat protein